MFSIRRTTRPAPKRVDPIAVVAGLRAFADDLEAGDAWAVDCISPRGEMPMGGEEWAQYIETRDWLRDETARDAA